MNQLFCSFEMLQEQRKDCGSFCENFSSTDLEASRSESTGISSEDKGLHLTTISHNSNAVLLQKNLISFVNNKMFCKNF